MKELSQRLIRFPSDSPLNSKEEDSLALKISAHLYCNRDRDSALLTLIRALLLKGGHIVRAVGRGPALALFPVTQTKLILYTYANALMEGLVAAQKAARERVGVVVFPHPSSARPTSLTAQANPVGGKASLPPMTLASPPPPPPPPSTVGSSYMEKQLSCLFILESTLTPSIELLESWGC